MGDVRGRALHQSFLPPQGPARALVWKFSLEFRGRRPRHFHAEPELNLIVSGTATFGVGEDVVTASKGDLLGFPPGQDHVLLETSPDLYLYAIGIDPRLSSEVLRSEAHRVAMPLHIRLSTRDFGALATLSSAIVDQDGVDQRGAELWEQVQWLRQRYVGRLSGATHALTRRALATVSEAPELGCEFLAQKARASLCEVSRYFHRDVGMTLVQYRARLRLLRFIDLVDTGATNLTSSAKAAGFGSYSQCHRIFQTELGCSPRQFFHSGLRQQMQLAYDDI
jgi:AraC-like DNA-binding protein/mannose-6-phosphate isomerase-like protein (cupin superfamily)